HLLWDGGLLVNTPLAPAVALGAEEIVTVLVTEPPEPLPGPLRHFGRAVERTVDSFLENAYNMDRKLLLERNRVTRLQRGPYREVILYEAVRPVRAAFFNAGSYLYFERGILGAMHDAGRQAGGPEEREAVVEEEVDRAANWLPRQGRRPLGRPTTCARLQRQIEGAHGPQPARDVLPVDDPPERLHPLGLHVEVLQVVGVLPH